MGKADFTSIAILASLFACPPSAQADTVKATNVDDKSALVSWTSNKPFQKFVFRVKCLDDPAMDKLTKPIIKPKPVKNGASRIILTAGKRYQVTVIAISADSSPETKTTLGSVVVKPAKVVGQKESSKTPGAIYMQATGQDLAIKWTDYPGYNSYRLSLSELDGSKRRQSGWMDRRKKYNFIRLKPKTSYIVILEGKDKSDNVKLLSKQKVNILG